MKSVLPSQGLLNHPLLCLSSLPAIPLASEGQGCLHNEEAAGLLGRGWVMREGR